MEYEQTCRKCHATWAVPVEDVWKGLATRPASWFPITEELRAIGSVTCPKCGTVQPSGYRFFGILSARGVLVVVALILLGMLAAASFLPTHW
jgi:hypothetical protein